MKFLCGQIVKTTKERTIDYSDCEPSITKTLKNRGIFTIPAGSCGEIIADKLDFGFEHRYPVRFFSVENYPDLSHGSDGKIGPGHYIPEYMLCIAEDPRYEDLEPFDLSGLF